MYSIYKLYPTQYGTMAHLLSMAEDLNTIEEKMLHWKFTKDWTTENLKEEYYSCYWFNFETRNRLHVTYEKAVF